MKNKIICILFISLFVVSACGKMDDSADESYSSGSRGSIQGNPSTPETITAGEWNDLNNWAFWESLMSKAEYSQYPDFWEFYTNNRIEVKVTDVDSIPVINALVSLKKNGNTVFTARTDNQGHAQLWANVFSYNQSADMANLTIDVNNGSITASDIKPYKSGINHVVLAANSVIDRIEISFVVDATGSMSDELEYLKIELYDVISRVKTDNPNSEVATSSVFYRDEGDDYITLISDFTTDINQTINFIKAQSADGGGDFPEAVHTALSKAINNLQWTNSAKTKILFLILDAPPHHESQVVSSIHTSTLIAAERGIKIIPVSASGINKETEFLMRFLAITTNGTYVFITDDSGVGNDHLEPTVGQFQVEFLNNLMVRLINKYAE